MMRFAPGRTGRAARLAMPALLVAVGLAMAGCGETRKVLGYEKSPPDEFKIVSRAPLSLPPDYNLRPPQPGAPRPQEQSVPDMARQVLLGGSEARPSVTSNPVASPGEAAFLAKVGVSRSDPRIREIVDRETVALAEADRTLLDRIVFWREPEQPGTVVDPEREAQRLRENQALGRPITDGDTPTIRRRKKGALEGIF